MKSLLILLMFLLVACGRNSAVDSRDSSVDLTTKYELYQTLSKTQADSNGFILTNECDSLLFSGLYGTTMPVNLALARDSSNMWHRRASNYPECYPNSTGSTISRDMLLGVLWYSWVNKDLPMAESIFQYGLNHDWIMGQGDISTIYFVPGLQATLAELIYRLGGENHFAYRAIPQVYSQNTGFQAHLDLLHILLRSELEGSVPNNALDILKYQYNRNSTNPLFSYAYHKYTDGVQEETIRGLLNNSIWPADRLPTNHDHCEPWVTQRDPGSDWQPCGLDQAATTFPGADFLFLARLVGSY